MKRILIIEDDPIVAHIYKSRLEKEGFKVEVSADGQTGYYRIYDLKPEAILLDLMLPKMNGIDLLKKIRAVRDFEKVPILVFTNAYVANMIHEAFSAGATAIYNKSTVTPRQVIDALNAIFTGTFVQTGPDAKAASPAGATATQPDKTSSQGSTSSAPAAAKAPGVLKSIDDDKVFEAELLKSFLSSSGTWVSDMRKSLQETTKATDESARLAHLEHLYRKVRTYSTNANLAGVAAVAKLGAATEALVKELLDKPKTITPSTLRTTAHALDCLRDITQPHLPADIADNPPINILVVDDEMMSRRAILYALEKAFLKAVSVESPDDALKQTAATKFDLVFLDVHMPGMDGFALCEKLRETGSNRTTPVVFVTSTADFQARAQSTLRGASDLIAKPFMFIELTVKALTFALRARVERLKPVGIPQPKEVKTNAVAPADVIL
jgi:DNA-binding response OmpR family regulator